MQVSIAQKSKTCKKHSRPFLHLRSQISKFTTILSMHVFIFFREFKPLDVHSSTSPAKLFVTSDLHEHLSSPKAKFKGGDVVDVIRRTDSGFNYAGRTVRVTAIIEEEVGFQCSVKYIVQGGRGSDLLELYLSAERLFQSKKMQKQRLLRPPDKELKQARLQSLKDVKKVNIVRDNERRENEARIAQGHLRVVKTASEVDENIEERVAKATKKLFVKFEQCELASKR
jgi:hypothetical protein